MNPEITLKTTTLINLFTGLYGTYIIQYIKELTGAEGRRAMLLSLTFSTVFGFLSVAVAGDLTASSISDSTLQVLAAATLFYKFFGVGEQ